MTLRRTSWIAIGAVSLVLGCGSGEGGGGAKPDETTGSEAVRLVPGAWEAPTIAGRPATARDVVLRAFGESPIGPISEEARGAYELTVEIRNRSDAPIRVDPAFLHVSLYRGGLLIAGCNEPNPRVLEIGHAIAPGASEFVSGPLPCAVTDPGRYDVVVVLITGQEAEPGVIEPVNARTSASAQLVVDDALPPYAGTQPPRDEAISDP
ncbi:MAG: hypothetical protein M3Y87_37610 [Myxococcota bacterium]|nr:hypothetical protein [Myxococcota bacterium]